MRSLSRLVLAAAVAASLGAIAPAQAYEPASFDEVTVTFNPMVDCVTFPCWQPTPVTVCVKRAAYCTPK